MHGHHFVSCRSGRYELNTSSDGEYLIQSPAQSPQQQPNVSKESCCGHSFTVCMYKYDPLSSI